MTAPPIDASFGCPPVVVVKATAGGGPRGVRLRRPGGRTVARGVTDPRGLAVLPAPVGEVLLLDVIGTDAVGIPVQAGQTLRIVLDRGPPDRGQGVWTRGMNKGPER